MPVIGMLAIVVLGVVMGAVVNRLGADLPTRRGLHRPRCPYCGRDRPWHQWIALPATVVARARCPHCAAPIPLRYPLVELALGFLFAFLYLRYGPTLRLAFYAAYTAILALIAVTDLERRLILNVVTWPAMLLALVGALCGVTSFTGSAPWWIAARNALLGGAIGYGFFWLAAIIGRLLVGPGALGDGDVKLAGFIGLVTGFPLVIEALVLAILSGGLVSLLLIVTRRRALRDPIPYGPFLILGGWVTMVWGLEIAGRFLH